MKGAVIYFSGTGNTEYIAVNIKKELEARNMICSMFDVRKKKSLGNEYDFFVLGTPIYAEMVPELYMNWIDKNMLEGRKRKCFLFSTQAEDCAPGVEEISRLLEERDFEIVIKDCIKMPNNYYLGRYKKTSMEENEVIKNKALERIAFLVNSFLKDEKVIADISNERLQLGREFYKEFSIQSKSWARDNISVDYTLCVRCGKCAKNCPVKNISTKDDIIFNSNCISCQRCVHNCPVNAFLYKGEHFEQYKL